MFFLYGRRRREGRRVGREGGGETMGGEEWLAGWERGDSEKIIRNKDKVYGGMEERKREIGVREKKKR